MHFLLKINWQIFRILLFYDCFILSKDHGFWEHLLFVSPAVIIVLTAAEIPPH